MGVYLGLYTRRLHGVSETHALDVDRSMCRLPCPPPVLTAGAFLLISLIGRHSARQQMATWWRSWEVRPHALDRWAYSKGPLGAFLFSLLRSTIMAPGKESAGRVKWQMSFCASVFDERPPLVRPPSDPSSA